tara:strand:- start:225 stop:329 length:105 start_codon:yes stop_codon:yes gene_type:complete
MNGEAGIPAGNEWRGRERSQLEMNEEAGISAGNR